MDELVNYEDCWKCNGTGLMTVSEECCTQLATTCDVCAGLGKIPEDKKK